MVKLLLDKGVEIGIKDRKGQTPLCLAVIGKCTIMFEE